MNLKNLLLEKEENKHNSLLLLDIDKTLVEPKNIFIYRKLPTDKEEVKLTPEEFAKDPAAKESKNKQYYDFREFRDANKVAESIKTGIPLIKNLKIMDNYISQGWKIGILTARGMEDVVASTMSAWLKFKNEDGKLENIASKLARELVFAINDDTKNYEGYSDFERKANVIKNLAKKYDRIYLIDDDEKNIKAVNKMAKEANLHNKIRAILAKS